MKFLVDGGRPLGGPIRPSGNKTAALPIGAATLLTEHPVTLQNVPRIKDIEILVELLATTGADAKWTGPNTLRVHAKSVSARSLDLAMCSRIRGSILLAAPLLARCGEVTLSPPGGDVIGRRRLDTHFLALAQRGADHVLSDRVRFTTQGLKGAAVF